LEYAIVFTAYACIAFYNRNLARQVWARACPGATGLEYAIVFTAYACIAFYNRNLARQVWARGAWNAGIMG